MTLNTLELFDTEGGYEQETGVAVAKGLTPAEQKEAVAIYRLFNDLWGLAVVRGEPGAGKDTFLNWLLYRCKRYYPYKPILRDEKPRPLFGAYANLFNKETLKSELDKMAGIASSNNKSGVKYEDALEQAANEWIDGDGARVLLQNGVLGMTEYWKWVYNREPHRPENKAMGAIHKMARHMNLLVIGNVQQESDIDKKTSKPFINWRVTCSRPSIRSTRYTFIVERVKYDRKRDLLIPYGRPKTIAVDAGRPRSYMGDGRIIIRKPNYVPETAEEAMVYNLIRQGVDRYEDIVLFNEVAGIPEHETLEIVKDLGLYVYGKRPKMAIWYPCDYNLFNSKSTPNVISSIRIGS